MQPTASISAVPLFLFFLASSAHAATITFTEGTFHSANMSTTIEVLNLGGTGFALHHFTNGDPGPFWHVYHTTNSASGESFANSVYSFHHVVAATFTPSNVGAIMSIDYSEASVLWGGGNHACGIAIRQGGVVYYGPNFLNPSTLGVWSTTVQPGLTAANFDALAPGVQNPDFSGTGGQIELGFFRASSTSVGGAGSASESGIDNWNVTVNYEVPVATERTTWGKVKAFYR